MGRQKAAMLLMSMDVRTAAELLKGLPPEEVQQLALELARIDTSGRRDTREEEKVAREFCESLQKGRTRGPSIKSFLSEILTNIFGRDKAEEVQSQIRKATEKKDPCITIRSASTDALVLALEGEHPQTIAVVLSELPPAKSQEVLSLLSDEVRLKAVCKMTNPEVLAAGVRQRMVSMVSERLGAFEGEAVLGTPEKREHALRKLAIVLSGLEGDLRDQLLGEISKRDEETSAIVRNLMVTWEDIPSIADRSLQEALRAAEPTKLAVALYGADEEIVQKIRSNISERIAAMLDEEASLMQEPLEKEILDAREEIVTPLRKANEEGTLRFVRR